MSQAAIDNSFTKEDLLDLKDMYDRAVPRAKIMSKYPKVTEGIFNALFPDKIVEMLEHFPYNSVYVPYLRKESR